MKLIFHYGDPYLNLTEMDQWVLFPKCFLIGELTKPFIVKPVGVTGSFVVRFHPHGFFPFTTSPIKEMENTAVPLDKLFGDDGARVGEAILSAPDTARCIELIETFLLGRLHYKKFFDTVFKFTLNTIYLTNGKLAIGDFSDEMNITRRHMARKFSSTIGLSPKKLAKTIRIQSALKSLLSKEMHSFTEVAYQNDYFD